MSTREPSLLLNPITFLDFDVREHDTTAVTRPVTPGLQQPHPEQHQHSHSHSHSYSLFGRPHSPDAGPGGRSESPRSRRISGMKQLGRIFQRLSSPPPTSRSPVEIPIPIHHPAPMSFEPPLRRKADITTLFPSSPSPSSSPSSSMPMPRPRLLRSWDTLENGTSTFGRDASIHAVDSHQPLYVLPTPPIPILQNPAWIDSDGEYSACTDEEHGGLEITHLLSLIGSGTGSPPPGMLRRSASVTPIMGILRKGGDEAEGGGMGRGIPQRKRSSSVS